MASVTIYRENCDHFSFFTVQIVTADWENCDLACSLSPAESTVEFVTFRPQPTRKDLLRNRENCDLSNIAFATEQERKKNELKKEKRRPLFRRRRFLLESIRRQKVTCQLSHVTTTATFV
jgi:hypothetical protein